MPLKHTVELVTLKNGAIGLFIDAPDSTMVHYDIYFRAGNDYVARPEASQTAHILEHMSFGPNEKYESLEEFSQDFSRNGAYNNAWTGSVGMSYSADAPLLDWDRVLDLHILAISKPTFQQHNLESEKGNVREELVGYGNNHRRILWQTMMRKAGLNRWFDSDEIKTIDTVTLDDVKYHHAKTHTTRNMRFVIAGDLKKHRAVIIKKLEAISLPAGELLPVALDSPKPAGPVSIERSDLPSLTFSLSFLLNRQLSHAELRAMGLLSHVLTDTFHSRIFGQARTRGICYGMGSGGGSTQTDLADWWFGGQVSAHNAQELFTLIAEELVAVSRDGLTPEEMSRAKEHRFGGLQMGSETVRSLVGWYADDFYETDQINYLSEMPERIAATTNEEIIALVREFLASEAWSLGIIGNIDEQTTARYYRHIAKILGKKTQGLKTPDAKNAKTQGPKSSGTKSKGKKV